MRTRSAVIGGLLDSGFAAMAAFASSVYASRTFDVGLLGYYAIFLTAFLAASSVPGQLLFFPYEVTAVAAGESRRIAYVHRALVRGLPLSVISAVVAAGVAAWISWDAGKSAVIALGVSMAAAAALSPLQDHVRRMMHVDQRSGAAAVVSTIQFGGVIGLVFLLSAMGAPDAWIPYGALAGANLLSLAYGLAAIERRTRGRRLDPPPFRSIARSGSWLLYITLLGPVVGLAVNSLVLAIADEATLGFAEAARQTARPLLVVTTGLGMALRPRSFAAAQRKRRSLARRIELIFVGITILAGAAYTALVTVSSPLNVMAWLIPRAYEVTGLVLAVCVSNIVVGIAFPTRYELVGAGEEASVAAAESVGQAARLSTAAFTRALGPFAIAAGDAALGLVRFAGQRLRVPQIYRDAVDGGDSAD